MKAIGLALGTLVAGLGVGWFLFSRPAPAPEGPSADERIAALEKKHEGEMADLKASLAAAEERGRKEAAAATARAEEAEERLGAVLEERAAEAAARAEGTPLAADGEPVAGATVTAEGNQRFSFPEYDDALGQIDWDMVGASTRDLIPLIEELQEALRKGGPLPLENIGKIQQNNAQLIQAAAKIQDRLPGTGVNGSFTHPAFMVNSMAATLEAAGQPLSESQLESLGRLGRDFSERDQARTAGYGDGTYRLVQVLDEADLKDKFFAQAFSLMTPKQVDTLSPPATRGVLSFDLFTSGLLLAQFALPVNSKDRDTYLKGLGDVFVSRGGFPEEKRGDLDLVLRTWGADLPADWFNEETLTIMGVQPILEVALVEAVGRRQLALLRRVVEEMGVSEEVADGIRGSPAIAVPVIRLPKKESGE